MKNKKNIFSQTVSLFFLAVAIFFLTLSLAFVICSFTAFANIMNNFEGYWRDFFTAIIGSVSSFGIGVTSLILVNKNITTKENINKNENN